MECPKNGFQKCIAANSHIALTKDHMLPIFFYKYNKDWDWSITGKGSCRRRYTKKQQQPPIP
ncbi:hypothetical protein FRX31_026741 [Thalictrum thalictroides]|uniref:Uncharacterized protein n=1 Tax=Thalictrum thalictroides TaxID=46969 RepID=A0A7J6VHA5_THATH|nr:hypothetical protein FRX31_026741 [Thalictrum thalictroides]